jgi:hypothetical protein
MDAFEGPLLVAAVAFAFYVFTRTLTNRAAVAFQRDIPQEEPSQRE